MVGSGLVGGRERLVLLKRRVDEWRGGKLYILLFLVDVDIRRYAFVDMDGLINVHTVVVSPSLRLACGCGMGLNFKVWGEGGLYS